MNQSELTKTVAERMQVSQREASRLIKKMFATIAENLDRHETTIVRGFGSFSTRIRKARKSYHPSKKQRMIVPPRVTVVFRPSKRIKERFANEEER